MPIQLGRLYGNTKELYKTNLIAGAEGLGKVVSWAHIMEDCSAVHFIRGSELILTTAMGAPAQEQERWLLDFVQRLRAHHASGLIVNTGHYVKEIPPSLIRLCDELDFPLMTIPWEVHLVDIVRNLCNRIFDAEQSEESVTKAFRNALFSPGDRESYLPFLSSRGYRTDATYCVFTLQEKDALFADKEQAERFDALVRNKLNRLGARYHVFRHNDKFIVIFAGPADPQGYAAGIGETFEKHYVQYDLRAGVGPLVQGLEQLHVTYKRSLLALRFTDLSGQKTVWFEGMGLYRMILSTDDTELLREMLEETLGRLIRYDQEHQSDNMDILRLYIQNNFSVQQVSAQTYMHRNTINYRVRKIKEILGTDLESMDEKLRFLLAFYIYDIL